MAAELLRLESPTSSGSRPWSAETWKAVAEASWKEASSAASASSCACCAASSRSSASSAAASSSSVLARRTATSALTGSGSATRAALPRGVAPPKGMVPGGSPLERARVSCSAAALASSSSIACSLASRMWRSSCSTESKSICARAWQMARTSPAGPSSNPPWSPAAAAAARSAELPNSGVVPNMWPRVGSTSRFCSRRSSSLNVAS
mmetsp:Transcript_2272/g.6780  ORF Transcript_2272/g.6780 Transcript_2272/m.6780 type:complete len:207 (+) Transcript_2272:5300-5920(+)